MIVLEKGKGYITKIECIYCNAKLGLIFKDIYYNSDTSNYYTECPECGMEFKIPKELLPYEVKIRKKYLRTC